MGSSFCVDNKQFSTLVTHILSPSKFSPENYASEVKLLSTLKGTPCTTYTKIDAPSTDRIRYITFIPNHDILRKKTLVFERAGT